MTHRYRVLAIVALVVLTAGCADVEMEVTVSADGEIDQVNVDVHMDEETYDLLESQASSDGHDSVAEHLANNMDDADRLGSLEAEDIETDDGYTARLTWTDVDVDDYESIEIEETDDGTLTYTDTEPWNEANDESDIDAFTYAVVMPGEIVDSNADQVDGDTATWTAEPDGEMYAESEVDSDGDGTPGFGVGAAGAAVALCVLGFVARRH